jgi:hypothetical protein
LEGVPGLGKTMLVRTFADVIDCTFNRIQFTPDLMPADIIGTNVLIEQDGQRQFRFQPGPVFANLLLADEINRATPKTQSALLEAMQEQQVSVARDRHKLEPPFFVLATQNPLEMEGTYPLPEAQLDRFLFKLWVPFPSEEDLVEIMERTTGATIHTAKAAANAAEVVQMQRLARSVPIAPHVTAYAVSVLSATHPEAPRAPSLVKEYVRYGGSPRGAQALVPGRQDPCPARRSLQRCRRGRPRSGDARAASPRNPQFRGRGRGDHQRRHRSLGARCGACAVGRLMPPQAAGQRLQCRSLPRARSSARRATAEAGFAGQLFSR